MKKVWKKPELVVLAVSETEARPKNGYNTDGRWVDGAPKPC